MANIIIPKALDAGEKLALMNACAKYDIADSESFCENELTEIRENVKSRSAIPKVPKIFLSNDCIFNCAYCDCRESRDCGRYSVSPREIADIAVAQARRSKSGIFITSAIYKNPNYTEELIIQALKIIRTEHMFTGYVHAKVMPGTDPLLIREAGLYANRLSINIEVARSAGYDMIARNKNKRNILTPMGQISGLIAEGKYEREKSAYAPRFATSQSTQLMAGSTGEDDFTILNLTGALYKKYNLSRVYYTSFTYQYQAKGYDGLPQASVPAWRTKRLYQADRLMQLYGFGAEEIAPDGERFLCESLEPKAAWALRNLHLFPVEVNRADYEMLIRVPGIGATYAKRIIHARKICVITPEVLLKLGVPLKRAGHFILCAGKAINPLNDETALRKSLSDKKTEAK